MAILPLFTHGSSVKHTDNTSIDQSNDYPTIVRDNNGRYIMFYEKRLKTGRTSTDVITFTSPSFDCNVPAGTGEINGIPVSWSSDVLTLPSDSYVLVYVTSSGVVGYSDDFPISFTKDVIILAFAYVGASSIVRIINTERDGFYIFHRKQVLSGSDYVWEDYEYKLNVGIKPEAIYDSTNDKVYLSFQKDGASMVRMFDLTNPNTWKDINHILLVDPTLYPVPQPKIDLLLESAYSKASVEDVSLPLYDFATDVMVGLEIGSNDPYIHIPHVTSSFMDYATFPCKIQIFSKSGSIYTLQAEFDAYDYNRFRGLSQLWSYSRGDKYAGLEVEHTLYSGNYITLPSNYFSFFIPDNIDVTEIVDSTHSSTKIYPEVWDLESSYGSSSEEKISEYDQLYKFPEDLTFNDLESAYSNSTTEKLSEYDQTCEFPEDLTLTELESAYSHATNTIVDA